MYNHANISGCFRGLIGFDQSYNVEHPELDTDLAMSASGMFINNSLHPLITFDNILAIAEQFDKVAIRTYSGSITYRMNDIVKSGNDVYQSIADANGGYPVTDIYKWKKTNLYSAFLRRLYSGSVLKLFNQVFTEKKLNEVAKTLHKSINLFEGVGNIMGRITKQGRMVGYKIKILNPDVLASLNAIGLQMDTVQDPVNIYLFHPSSTTPLKVFSLGHAKSIQLQWHNIPQTPLAYMNDVVNAGDAYYLCYYENDLTGSAIKKEITWDGTSTCGSCSESIVNSRLYAQRNKFIDVQPFYVNTGKYTVGEPWLESDELYLNDTNWGLNLQLSIQCDVSNFLCENSNVFVSALAQQITVDLLQEMAYSLRDNQMKEKIAALAATALDNQEGGQYGEVKKLTKAIQAISFDLTGLNRLCMPDEQKQRAKLTSVWR